MQISFSKYHGTGNDFILIDNRKLDFPNSRSLIHNMCHRRFGIGADGLMLIENAEGYDFRMRYFNSDGSEASMCGNGGRCIVAFAKKLKIIDTEAVFIAFDGKHSAKIHSNNSVSLQMQNVSIIEKKNGHTFLDTGSPHAVLFIDSHDNFDTHTEGEKIRYSEEYIKDGTNVNFVSIQDQNNITVSTYERGVETETYSCGTGCVASAISCSLNSNNEYNNYNITTKGGTLSVSFEYTNNIYTNIILNGPTHESYTGKYIYK